MCVRKAGMVAQHTVLVSEQNFFQTVSNVRRFAAEAVHQLGAAVERNS